MMDSRYFEPATVEEACALLVERGEGAKVVAGGQSLALLLRRALIDPSCLVSVQNVAGLDHITASQEGVKIGAMVALHSLESAGDEEPALEALSEAVKKVADRQIRNRATLGGSICAAHPASDITAILMALDATVKLVSANGERVVALSDFVVGAFKNTAQPGELLTEVVVPTFAHSGSAAAYSRFALRPGDFPVVGVGAFVGLDHAGRCQEQRLVLGNCLRAPARAPEAEQRLQGCNPATDDQALAEAADLAAAHISPLSEPMASGAYKKDLVSVLAREALKQAAGRAATAA